MLLPFVCVVVNLIFILKGWANQFTFLVERLCVDVCNVDVMTRSSYGVDSIFAKSGDAFAQRNRPQSPDSGHFLLCLAKAIVFPQPFCFPPHKIEGFINGKPLFVSLSQKARFGDEPKSGRVVRHPWDSGRLAVGVDVIPPIGLHTSTLWSEFITSKS